MYNMVGGPQSSWGLEDQQGGDAAWMKAQSHVAVGSGDDPASWTPAMLHTALEADPFPLAAEVGTVPLFPVTSCRGDFLMPLPPNYKKAGKMVSGTSTL